MFQQLPLPVLPALFIALIMAAPALRAETNVQVLLERIMSPEVTSKDISLGGKMKWRNHP